jgi:hypothetical protein
MRTDGAPSHIALKAPYSKNGLQPSSDSCASIAAVFADGMRGKIASISIAEMPAHRQKKVAVT